ncbi:MAG: type II toxin-antitoxin system VapC family toxin [Acidobacteria bacterium]|nr:type II toxin-antitoxin system VapC family toxin [Acidobacteriota bacterium]
MRVYFDANALIYSVEGPPDLRKQVLEWVDRIEAAPAGTVVTSPLSFLECRVKPLRLSDDAALTRLDAILDASNLLIADVTAHVIAEATETRARYGFRTPDALHLATAVLHQAETFLTGDSRLRRFDRIPIAFLESADRG